MAIQSITLGDRDWDTKINDNYTFIDAATLTPSLANQVNLNRIDGLRVGSAVSGTTNNVYISPGGLEIYDATSAAYYMLPAQITVNLGVLSNSTLYYIYVTKPSTGRILTTTEFSASTSAPSLDSTRGDYYRNVTTVWYRLIAVLMTTSSGIIDDIYDQRNLRSYFATDNTFLQWNSDITDATSATTDGYITGVAAASLKQGGTGSVLADPNKHSVLMWDYATQAIKFVEVGAAGTNLVYTAATNTLTAVITSRFVPMTKTASYTIVKGDFGKSIRLNSSNDITITLDSIANIFADTSGVAEGYGTTIASEYTIQFVKRGAGRVIIQVNSEAVISWESKLGGKVINSNSSDIGALITLTLTSINNDIFWSISSLSGEWDIS